MIDHVHLPDVRSPGERAHALVRRACYALHERLSFAGLLPAAEFDPPFFLSMLVFVLANRGKALLLNARLTYAELLVKMSIPLYLYLNQ